ncbi:MAG TPA: DUF6461 domain-containing protein [Mycobacteriales bacterium]|nr:DUF6461 domain-containing protein [Mycobacteriales bacterium]
MLKLERVRRYAWADEAHDLAWTLAVVEGLDPAGVVAAYGGDPARSVGSITFEQEQVPVGEFGKYHYLQVLARERHVLAIENNGWAGKSVEVAKGASRDRGRFFSVYWSLNANYTLTQAIDGRIVAHFDPLTVQHPAPPGEIYPAWITDVVFTDDSLHAVLLALLEEQTGLAFAREWLTAELPAYRIPDDLTG